MDANKSGRRFIPCTKTKITFFALIFVLYLQIGFPQEKSGGCEMGEAKRTWGTKEYENFTRKGADQFFFLGESVSNANERHKEKKTLEKENSFYLCRHKWSCTLPMSSHASLVSTDGLHADRSSLEIFLLFIIFFSSSDCFFRNSSIFW